MKIIYPGSPEYDQARRVGNKRIDAHPAAIFFCATIQDVKDTITVAKNNNKNLRIRAGGHSYEGFSVGDQDCYVLDVSALNSVEVDRTNNTAMVGGGALLYYDVYLSLWNAGKYTIPGGSCPTVSVGGLVAGGGFSFSGRHYGLTCDSVISIDIVTANGELLTINQQQNPEIFWACCGGGNGNFGVIVSYTFKLYPATDVAIYSISWDLDSNSEAICNAWAQLLGKAPTELMTFLRWSVSATSPQPLLTSFGQFYGAQSDLEDMIEDYFGVYKCKTKNIETLSNIDAVRHWGGVHKDNGKLIEPHFMRHTHAVGFPKEKKSLAPHFTELGYFKASSLMLHRFFNSAELNSITKAFASLNKGSLFMVLDSQEGGVSSHLPLDYNAYAHRAAFSSVQIYISWDDPSDETYCTELVESIRSQLVAASQGAYVNYCDSNIADWQSEYYKENYSRLVQVKQKFDPDNLFRHLQSIDV